jgi:hypothetical protein
VGTPAGDDLTSSPGAGRGEEGQNVTVQTLDRQRPAQADLEFKTLEALPELPKPANSEAIASAPDSGPRRRTAKATSAAVPVAHPKSADPKSAELKSAELKSAELESADPKPAELKPAELKSAKRKSERKTAKAGAKAKARSEGKSKAKAKAKKTKTGR